MTLLSPTTQRSESYVAIAAPHSDPATSPAQRSESYVAEATPRSDRCGGGGSSGRVFTATKEMS